MQLCCLQPAEPKDNPDSMGLPLLAEEYDDPVVVDLVAEPEETRESLILSVWPQPHKFLDQPSDSTLLGVDQQTSGPLQPNADQLIHIFSHGSREEHRLARLW